MPDELSFEGGPLDGETVHGLYQRVILDTLPPYACFNIEGRYEHYVRETEQPTYRHVGGCHLIALAGMHPACGHDHEEDW